MAWLNTSAVPNEVTKLQSGSDTLNSRMKMMWEIRYEEKSIIPVDIVDSFVLHHPDNVDHLSAETD